MFFKKKEKILNLKIGKVCATTLKENPEMIKREYEALINKKKSEMDRIQTKIISKMDDLLLDIASEITTGYSIKRRQEMRRYGPPCYSNEDDKKIKKLYEKLKIKYPNNFLYTKNLIEEVESIEDEIKSLNLNDEEV